MKLRHSIIILFSTFLIQHVYAQTCESERYLKRVFNQSVKISDVVYATAESLTPVYVNEATTYDRDLGMDIYMPSGDSLIKRPLVVLLHGGGFIAGSRNNEDIAALSDTLARRGFVTSNISYRLGMNVALASSAERAVFRAVQDLSAAIRYLKENATNFGIDTNYVYVGGSSAGAVASYHLAFMSEQQKPSSISGGGIFTPDLGCIDCSGNTYNYSSLPNGVIGFWGAIADTSFIENPPNETPVIMFHGDQDLIVDYDYGIPFTLGITLPALYGSLNIAKRLQNQNIYHEFYTAEGEGHEYWGALNGNFGLTGPNAYWEDMIEKTAVFLHKLMIPETSIITGNTSVPYGQLETYTSSYNNDYEHCWEAVGALQITPNGNQIEVLWDSTLTNGQLSLTVKSPIHTVSDTAFLSINNVFVSNANIAFKDDLKIYPNPSKNFINIEFQTQITKEKLNYEIRDIAGRLMLEGEILNQLHQINLENFSKGIYFISIKNKEAYLHSEKIMVLD